jgi:glucose/arabinose dehydrogenase
VRLQSAAPPHAVRSFGVAALLSSAAACAFSQGPPLERIQLPPGFRIEILAPVPNARSLALGAKGTLFVGSRSGGAVHAVAPGGKVSKVAEGLSMPNGVAFRDGALYIGEVSRILKIENAEAGNSKPEVVYDKLPGDVHHGWKFIRFAPDGKLYIPIGAPCNVCDRNGYALIGALDLKTKAFEVHSRGVRNTVGFDWHPQTRELWFTDNGRDWLGDELPADELNHAPRAGLHFGFPHCHQGDLPDPEFGRSRRCDNSGAEFQPPAQKLGPHVAALGMRFYTGSMFPAEYRNQIFIAEHGSWNRSKRSGYRISIAKIEGNKVVAYQPFAQGWLQGESAWGRPVDLEILPDGSLAVSDDSAGMIYRISYSGPR